MSQDELARKDPAKESSPAELAAIGEIVRGLAEPYADAEKVKATEHTKQVAEQTKQVAEQTRVYEIGAKIARQFFWMAGALALAVVGLAFVAMFLGQSQLAEKVVVGLFAFLGGFGVGRTSRKP